MQAESAHHLPVPLAPHRPPFWRSPKKAAVHSSRFKKFWRLKLFGDLSSYSLRVDGSTSEVYVLECQSNPWKMLALVDAQCLRLKEKNDGLLVLQQSLSRPLEGRIQRGQMSVARECLFSKSCRFWSQM